MKRVKLIDVANKAGVSKSTASQYLNGRYEYMSSDTKERIRLAIEELDFVPNPIARSLKTERTYTVGIMVSNITGPITSLVIRGIDDYCKEHNYNVLIYNTDYLEEIEKKSLLGLKTLRADGLIISSSGDITKLLNKENKNGLPIVHIHRSFDDLEVNTVLSDFKTGAYMATKHLIEQGHNRIALITRPYETIPSRRNRVNGYEEALVEHGYALDPDLIYVSHDSMTIETIYKELMALPDPPTVIFTLYTQITVDLLTYLNDNNISVPEEISVIAFDDLPLGYLLNPPLTVVNQSAYDLGQASAKLLLEKISQQKKNHEDVVLPCNLIIRHSVKQRL